MANAQNFVSRYRDAAEALIQALDALDALKNEYAALGYGTTFPAGAFTGHEDINETALRDGVAAVDLIRDRIAASGLAPKLYKLHR